MNSLPRFSPKRLREIADGTRNRDGSRKVTVADIQARQGAMGKKVADALFGKVKPGKSAKRKAMEAADKWFSEWIRLRDSDEYGIATCVTSGRRAHWRTMDCGHYVSRAKQSTRYDESNCHAQSKMANRFQGGHFVEHGNRIDELHGEGTAEALRKKGLLPCRRRVEHFEAIATNYRILVEWIRENKPEKYAARTAA